MHKLRYVLLILVLLVSFTSVTHSQSEEWERHSVDEQMDVFSTEALTLWLPEAETDNIQSFVDSVYENYGVPLDNEQVRNAAGIGDLLTGEDILGAYYIFDQDSLSVIASIEYLSIDFQDLGLNSTIDGKKNIQNFIGHVQESTGYEFVTLNTSMGIVTHSTYVSNEAEVVQVIVLIPTVSNARNFEYYLLIGYCELGVWNDMQMREVMLKSYSSFTYDGMEYSSKLYESLAEQN